MFENTTNLGINSADIDQTPKAKQAVDLKSIMGSLLSQGALSKQEWAELIPHEFEGIEMQPLNHFFSLLKKYAYANKNMADLAAMLLGQKMYISESFNEFTDLIQSLPEVDQILYLLYDDSVQAVLFEDDEALYFDGRDGDIDNETHSKIVEYHDVLSGLSSSNNFYVSSLAKYATGRSEDYYAFQNLKSEAYGDHTEYGVSLNEFSKDYYIETKFADTWAYQLMPKTDEVLSLMRDIKFNNIESEKGFHKDKDEPEEKFQERWEIAKEHWNKAEFLHEQLASHKVKPLVISKLFSELFVAEPISVDDLQLLLQDDIQGLVYDATAGFINKLTALERIGFTGLLSNLTQDTAGKIKTAAAEYGEPYLRSLLLAQFLESSNSSNLDDMISLLSDLEDREIFEDLVQKLSELILLPQESLSFGSLDERTIATAKAKFSRAIKALTFFESNPSSPEKVLEEIRSINLELAGELALWRQGFDIKADHYQVRTPIDLTNETKQSVLSEYQKAWEDKSPLVWQKLKSNLLEAFEDKNTVDNRFYLYGNIQDHPSAFVRFNDTGEKSVHVSALVVPDLMQELGLASYAYETAFDTEASKAIIDGECEPREFNNTRYIEKGFVATARLMVEDIEAVKIFRNDSMNQMFASKAMTKEALLDDDLPESGLIVRIFPNLEDTTYFDFSSEENLALTRSFVHTDGEQWVLVYEELPEDYSTIWAEQYDTSNK